MRVAANPVWVILVAYVAANLILLDRKVGTFEELRTFSIDEPKICERAQALISAGSLVPYDSTQKNGGPQSCDPQPYGQLYLIAISAPLIFLQLVTPVTESTIVTWAVVILIACGAATLFMTYLIGTRLYGHVCGLLASLLLLGTPEFGRWSHEIHPDLLQLALLTSGFYFAVVLYERRTSTGRRWMIDLSLAAFCAGAAMATKFNGVFLLPIIAIACNGCFLSGAQPFTWRSALARNAVGGALCVAVFALAAMLFSPCFVLHPNLLLDPLERAASITSTQLAQPEVRRVGAFLHSNRTIAEHLLGYAGYGLAAGGIALAGWGLLMRRASELERARILAEVLVIVVLFYSLGLGYGLVDGVLLERYERYVLPAVPLAYVSGMRLVAAIGRRRRATAWAGAVLATVVLLGQSSLFAATARQYTRFYQAQEMGNFRVYDWVLEHIPRGARIYTEFYIRVPRQGYLISRGYAVSSLSTMRAHDYVITKTLAYDVYRNPDRWHLYRTKPGMVRSREIYRRLERGAFPDFERVALLSGGEVFDGQDAVAIYRNLGRGVAAPR